MLNYSRDRNEGTHHCGEEGGCLLFDPVSESRKEGAGESSAKALDGMGKKSSSSVFPLRGASGVFVLLSEVRGVPKGAMVGFGGRDTPKKL